MITILFILSLLMSVTTPIIIEEPIPINSVEIREVEAPVIVQEIIVEDDWQSIFWSDKITKPIKAIKVSLPEGETIKVSAWDGEWYEGTETVLYKGGSKDMTIDGFCSCDKIAVYSTGAVEDLGISVCYADIQ